MVPQTTRHIRISPLITPKCTTTMGLNTRKLWVARHQNHNQHHQQTSNDQPTHKKKIGKYIIASPVDLTLALQYVQDGGLEKTRLQQIYDKYGLTSWFIRDDVVAMFHDSYSSTQASLNVHRSILRPVIGDIDDPDAILLEDTVPTSHQYRFNQKPSNEVDFEIPETDYTILQEQYPELPWQNLKTKIPWDTF